MPKRYYRISLMNRDLKKFSIITFISCMIFQEITCQKRKLYQSISIKIYLCSSDMIQ